MDNSVKNINNFKKELITDLDQFLLEERKEEQLTPAQVAMARQKALAELDKLIKQDLSYQQILSNVQGLKQKARELHESEPAAIPEVKSEQSSNQRSSHVLDLRPSKVLPSKKFITWPKFKPKKAVPKIKKAEIGPVDKQVFYQPASNLVSVSTKQSARSFFVGAWPKLSLQHVFSQVLVFALVTALVLLPIRALVFVNKVKQDKNQLLSLGQAGIFSLQTGILSASDNSYQAAQTGFEEALANFRAAQAVLNNYQSWLLDVGSQLPILGKSLSAGRNLLAVANNISEAATTLNEKVQADATLTDYLFFISQQLDKTLPYLEQANKDIAHVPVSSLPESMQPYWQSLVSDLPATITNLQSLNEIFNLLYNLLGHQQEKRYLVLFQNNNELRASGGFIGSFAILDIYQGQVKNLEIPKGGPYDLQAGEKYKIKAPQALSLINPSFNLWDANWWPDFPSSAKKIAWFYEQTGGSSVDGVVAINANVLQELLQIFGPVYLEKYRVTIDADNVYTILQNQVESAEARASGAPKAIISDLVPEVLGRLLSQTDKQKEVIMALAKLLGQKDIQVYSRDAKLQQTISAFGWSGESLDTDCDYLQVISTNIAGGKTDNDIYQVIEHQANIEANGEIIDTIKITRSNQGPEYNPLAGLDGGNTSYLRFYVPLGSRFISASGFDNLPANYFQNLSETYKTDPDIANEENKMIDSFSQTEIYESLNKTVFANWQTLRPGESKTVIIKYQLPFVLNLKNPLVNNWRKILLSSKWQLDHYSLLSQSQSGSHHTVFNSLVVLPDDLRVVWKTATQNDGLNIENNLVNYTQSLDKDQYFGFIIASQ